MASAVLSFRSKGVTKVLFFEPWAGYFAFLTAAQSQGYRPQYGLSSQEAPEVAIELGLVPTSQLAGAKLVSWWPIADVRDYHNYVGPRYALCSAIFKKAGVGLASDRTGLGTQMVMCENLLLIADAYRDAPRRLQGRDFVLGLERLGGQAQFATKPRGGFTAARHWGATTSYYGGFDTACGCFVLQPGPHAMTP